jgi:hypothetical protein
MKSRKLVFLPAEFRALLNMRGLAPAKVPHQGCPPQCAKCLGGLAV